MTAPVDEWHQNAGQRGDGIAKTIEAVDQEKEDDAQGDRSKSCQHPVEIGLDVRLFVHHDRLHFSRGQQESPRHLSDLFAPAPDVHFFGFLDQVFTEVGDVLR